MKAVVFVLLSLLSVFAYSAADNGKEVTHILAVVFFNEVAERAPHAIEPFTNGEDCMKEATKRNRMDPQMQRQDLRALGAEYVCLKIERVMI